MSLIDDIAERVASILMPRVAAMVNAASTRGRDAFALKSTYDATDHSTMVVLADTVNAPSITGNQVNTVRAFIASPHVGDQYGPIGDEWGIASRTQSGWIFHPHHLGPESVITSAQAPGAPRGERWIGHRNPDTGEYDLWVKWANDGASGDGLGGWSVGGGSRISVRTHGGVEITAADASGSVAVTAPTKVIITAPDVEIGADGGAALAFHTELLSLANAFATHAHSGVAAGAAVSGPPTASPPASAGTTKAKAV